MSRTVASSHSRRNRPAKSNSRRNAAARNVFHRQLRCEVLEHRLLLTNGPMVTGHTPVGAVTAPLSTVEVTFSELINRASISRWDMGIVDLQHPQFAQVGDYDVNSSWSSDSVSKCQVWGGRLFAATSEGLQVLDISNRTNPTLLSTYGGLGWIQDPATSLWYGSPGWTYGVTVVDGYAYVADYDGGLQILDVADPSSPLAASYHSPSDKDYAKNRVGWYRMSGQAQDVEVVGNYAFVAAGEAGLQIVDLTKSAPPVPWIPAGTGKACNVDVAGGIAYVADGSGGLHVIDVSNPDHPSLLGIYDKALTHNQALRDVQDVAVVGTIAYVADGADGLTIVDLSHLSSPSSRDVHSCALGGSSGFATGLTVISDTSSWVPAGRLALVADGRGGLQIVNVSDPAKPLAVGGQVTPGWACNDVAISGGLVYVADDTGGIRVLQFGVPLDSLTRLTDTEYQINLAQPLQNGDYAVVAGPQVQSLACQSMDQDRDGRCGNAGKDAYYGTFSVDIPNGVTINQAPTQSDPTTGSSVLFTVEFGSPVTPADDFATGDVSLSGSTAPGPLVATVAPDLSSPAGTKYFVTVTGMTGAGTVVASIPAGVAHDAANEPNLASTSVDNSVTVVTPVPVTINQASTQTDPACLGPVHFTVVFGAPVSDFTASDVTLSDTGPGTLVAAVTGSGTSYDVAVTGMTGGGIVTASIAAGRAHDANGAPNAASTGTDNSVTMAVPVRINRAAGQADTATAGPIHFTVVFGAPVTDFTADDVNLSNSTALGPLVATVTGSGTTYDVAVTGMTSSGTVAASIAAARAYDAAGVPNLASTSTDNSVIFTYDSTSPTVTINRATTQLDPTNTAPIRFTVVFSESVSDFDANDVIFSNSSVPGTLVVTNFSGGGTTYDVAVSGMTGSGRVVASIAAGVAQDAAGNLNLASTSTDNIVAYDITPPTVTIEQATAQLDPTNTGPICFRVVFSEPVSDFDANDVIFSNSSAPGTLAVANFSGSGTTYDVAVSGMTGSGRVVANIAAGVAQDAAGNLNLASTSTDNVVTYDITPPTATIEQATTQLDPTNTAPICFRVVFSESVIGFAADDVSLSGTATGTLVASVSGSGTTYDVVVTGMTGSGTVIADFAAGKAQDAAGNFNLASTSTDNVVTYDVTPPTVTIDQASTQLDPTNRASIWFTVVFSESVVGFAADDVSLSGTAPGTLVASVSGSGTTYNVAVSGMTGNGTVVASIGAGKVQDAAGNLNLASTSADHSVTLEESFSTIGLCNPATSTFFLRKTNDGGYADLAFAYGPADSQWTTIVGDWNGDGMDTVGLYKPTTSTFFLRNSNNSGYADIAFVYNPGSGPWIPIAGDWDGNGTDSVGLYNPTKSTFYLRNSNDAGYGDVTFGYGPANSGWTPVVGDWNGDGVDTVGLYNPTTSTFYLRNSNDSGYADATFGYGPANSGWTPIVGDWNGDWQATIGLYNPTASTFFLRNSNDSGYADVTFGYGPANGGWTPFVGAWTAAKRQRPSSVFQDPNVAALAQLLYTQGASINRNDAIEILTSIGSSASTGGATVTAGELADCQMLAANAAAWGMPDYVKVLAGDVVGGNPANVNYQGATLGNLAAGDTATKLDKLIDKWFKGTDHPTPTDASYTYQTTSGSLFVGGPSIDDMDQGDLGDCYFISALGSIANINTNAIQDMFVYNGDNTWTVRFYYSPNGASNGPYTADYVTVDKQLPTSGSWLVYSECGLSYSHPARRAYNDGSNELWIALAEKAYAQWNETGRASRSTTPTNRNGQNTYASIEGGFGVVYTQVLGQSAKPYWVDDSTKTVLQSAIDAHKAVMLGTIDFGTTWKDGLVGGHAYVVTAYSGNTFTLYNPWGANQNGAPMSLQVPWSTLIADCDEFALSSTAWDGGSWTHSAKTLYWNAGTSAVASPRAAALYHRFRELSTNAADSLFGGSDTLVDHDLILGAKVG
jgi:hypothetical protein